MVKDKTERTHKKRMDALRGRPANKEPRPTTHPRREARRQRALARVPTYSAERAAMLKRQYDAKQAT